MGEAGYEDLIQAGPGFGIARSSFALVAAGALLTEQGSGILPAG